MKSAFRVTFIFVALAATVASADVIHFKTGGRLEGVIVRETSSSVTMDVGMGSITIGRSRVARIERKESALSEYRTRLANVQQGDVRSYVALARFAAESDLRTESKAMWARVASLDPTNVEAHLALGHVLINGQYMDEEAAYRARGFIYLDGRWMSLEEVSLTREREHRASDDRRVEEARRDARDAEDRARRAEAEADAARARADAARSTGIPIYGGLFIGGGGGGRDWRPGSPRRPHREEQGPGCVGALCGVTGLQPVPAALPLVPNPVPPVPAPTPVQRAPPVRPSSIR